MLFDCGHFALFGYPVAFSKPTSHLGVDHFSLEGCGNFQGCADKKVDPEEDLGTQGEGLKLARRRIQSCSSVFLFLTYTLMDKCS